jgi:hypothetical protein
VAISSVGLFTSTNSPTDGNRFEFHLQRSIVGLDAETAETPLAATCATDPREDVVLFTGASLAPTRAGLCLFKGKVHYTDEPLTL